MTHDEIRLLLPWYAKDTLSATERAVVAAHTAACTACATELATIARLATAVEGAVERRPLPSPGVFSRISAQIAQETRASAPQPSTPAWWRRLEAWAASLMMPRFAPALALGLIVLQFGALTALGLRLAQPGGPGYVTQSGPESATPGTGTRVRIAFDERATEREIRATLAAAGATLVDGPSAAGFYVVSVADATRVDELRRAAPVRLVELLGR